MHAEAVIRWPMLKELISLSKSTVWRLEREGRFPRRRRLGMRAVGWLASEVQEWMQATGRYPAIGTGQGGKDDG